MKAISSSTLRNARLRKSDIITGSEIRDKLQTSEQRALLDLRANNTTIPAELCQSSTVG